MTDVRRLLVGATQCRADHLCDCTVLAERVEVACPPTAPHRADPGSDSD